MGRGRETGTKSESVRRDDGGAEGGRWCLRKLEALSSSRTFCFTVIVLCLLLLFFFFFCASTGNRAPHLHIHITHIIMHMLGLCFSACVCVCGGKKIK